MAWHYTGTVWGHCCRHIKVEPSEYFKRNWFDTWVEQSAVSHANNTGELMLLWGAPALVLIGDYCTYLSAVLTHQIYEHHLTCQIMRLWFAEREDSSLLLKSTDIPVTFISVDIQKLGIFSILEKTCEQTPYILTLMWFARWFLKRQI